MTTTDRQRILILGGGFAGLTVAAELERRLADRPDLEICLVNRTNYQLFTPMLSEVAGGGIEPSHIVNPIRAYLHRTNFREGNVTAIDLEKRLVQTEHPESHAPSELTYDRLILGLGSVTNYRNLPGVAEHCFALKTMADAQAVRDHILSLLEQASLIDEPAERSCLLTIVIAGGGFSGAELCGALEDFLSRALRFYPGLSRDEIRLVLVHPGPRLLPEVGEELADYARRDLVRRGIDVRLDARVESATSHDVSLAGGETIPTHTVVWTAGTSPSPVLQSLACDLDSRGAVVVNSFLEVPEWPGVYALGDCARVPDPRTNIPYPPTAQHAIREAETVARNVAASYSIGKRSAFVFDSIGSLAVLGHRTAVAEVKGRRFSGFLAWWMWRTVYWSKLPGLDRKIRVAVDWTLDLAFPADIVQLGSGRQHQDELDEAGLDHRDQSVPPIVSTRSSGGQVGLRGVVMMSELSLTNLAIVVAASFVAPLLLGLAGKPRLPLAVAETSLGILLGPSGLGLVRIDPPIQLLSIFGLVFLLLIAGLEIELTRLRGALLRRVSLGFALSMAIAAGIGLVAQGLGLIGSPAFLAIILTSTSLGLIVPVLKDAAQLDSPSGQLTMAGGTVSDFGPIILLSLFFSRNMGDPVGQLLLLAGLGLTALATALIVQQAERLTWLSAILNRLQDSSAQIRVRGAFLLLSGLVVMAGQLGLELILGAFLAGLVLRAVDRDEQMAHPEFRRRLEGVGFGIFVPIFFVASGVRFDLRGLLDGGTLGLVPIFLVALLLVRLPAILYVPLVGAKRALASGLLQATTLGFVVVATQLGIELGLVRPAVAAALVMAGMLSVLLYPIIALGLLRDGTPQFLVSAPQST